MISLNFTIVVNLFLFMLFMTVASRIAWKPMMRLVQRRVELFSNRRNAAQDCLEEAGHLHERYRKKVQETEHHCIRHMNEQVYAAHRERRNLIADLKNKADQELVQYHATVEKDINKERERFPELLPDLVNAMDHQVIQGGRLL